MDKFTVTKSWNKFGLVYLSFFIYEDQIYPIGTPITLTKTGKINCNCLVRNFPRLVTIKDHYYDSIVEHYVFEIEHATGKYTYDRMNPIDGMIESIDGDPIKEDKEEYFAFMDAYMERHTSDKLTSEETQGIMWSIRNGSKLENIVPPRFRGKEEIVREQIMSKPFYKDWEVPGLITGWILFTVYIFAVNIFKDWYVQLIIRVFGVFFFIKWRHNKIYGNN